VAALNYVTLICDLYNAQGAVVQGGFATFTQAAVLTDAPDREIIVAQPLTVPFGGVMLPQLALLATDNTAPLPNGWSWAVAFNVTGAPPGFNFFLPAGPASFTATNASPAVFTWTSPGAQAWQLQSLPNGTGVQLSGGSLPTGFSAATMYYVVGSSGFTFELAATPGGSPIGSTSTGSGTLTVVQMNMSALTAVVPVAQMAGYMPVPSGTAVAGYVPVVVSNGSPQTAWGPPSTGSVASVTAGDASIAIGGTGTNPTVKTGRLDQIASLHPPTSAVAMNGQKLTGLANGSAATDSAAFGQTPAGGNTATIGQGGTGQVTQQAAINALTGSQSAGAYLRSDGTNATLQALQAADLAIAQYTQRIFCV
jgi:hypothetical protein